MSIVTTWHHSEGLDPERTDAAFYVDAYTTHNLVATVRDTDTDTEVRVYCDGEMIAEVFETPEAAYALDWERHLGRIRYGDELAEYGINNDTDISDERLHWEHNAWFDLYDDSGDDLNSVCHSITEALEYARQLLARETV